MLLSLLFAFALASTAAAEDPAPGLQEAGEQAGKPVASVAAIRGAVLVRRAGEPLRAAVNQALYVKDAVTTGDGGSIKILLSDDSIVDLGPESQFEVESFDHTQAQTRTGVLSLLYGRLRALVSKSFSQGSKLEVRSGEVVMGVRGTEFVVNTAQTGPGEPARARLTVLEGSVSLGLPNLPPMIILAGQQVSAAGDAKALPAPVTLPESQLREAANDSTVQDRTFDDAIELKEGDREEGQGGSIPADAQPFAMAGDVISGAAEAVTDDAAVYEEIVEGLIGEFNETINDVPAHLLPGNFKTVTVTLSQ